VRYPKEAGDCLNKAAVRSCIDHVCTKHGLDYDIFSRSVNDWLARPRLSIACHAKALDVVTPLIQRYAMLSTAAINFYFGTTEVSRWLDSANAFAAREAQALDKAEKFCSSRLAPT
jgi:hypothetical protein